jgi:ankyrin repeat protein
MKTNYRYFKVYKLNNQLVDFGRVKISSESGKPLDAAKKLLSSICLYSGITNKLKCKAEFYIKETTKGSNKKIYGPYKGTFKKYEKPVIIERKDGSKVKHTIYPSIYKLKNKSTIQKGGDPNKSMKLKSYFQEKSNEFNRNVKTHDADFHMKFGTSNSKPEEIYQTPLLIKAVTERKNELVTSLLDSSSDINITDKDGNTPLILAINKYFTDKTDYRIIDFNKILNNYSTKIFEKDFSIIKSLLDKNADTNIVGNIGSALTIACYYRDYNIVKLLLEKNADVNIKNTHENKDTALTILLKGNFTKYTDEMVTNILKLLLRKSNIDLTISDIDGNTPLIIAVRAGNIGFVNLLLKSGKDVGIDTKNKYGNAALIEACSTRYPDINIINLLLDSDANVNIEAAYGKTPLIQICLKETPDIKVIGLLEVIKLLLDNGAKVKSNQNIYIQNIKNYDIKNLLLQLEEDENFNYNEHITSLIENINKKQQLNKNTKITKNTKNTKKPSFLSRLFGFGRK